MANLFAMNDSQPVGNMNYHFSHSMDIGRPYIPEKKREPLVQIHAWVLMGNHYHLLISEVAENGISQFLKKLNMGYSKYFNERYGRSGALFQGKTKKILVDRHAHFLWVLHYIHFNPLDYLQGTKHWRTQSLKNSRMALKWLRDYKWSSYRDYLWEPNFVEIVQESFMFENRATYMKEAQDYLESLNTEALFELSLE